VKNAASSSKAGRSRCFRWAVFFIIAAGLFFRTAGIYRGLKSESDFHPDAPKQVYSFLNYLNGKYIWYADSLFIDGYPLFLNHFDEWLTRPLAFVYEAADRHMHGERENLRLEGKPNEDYFPKGAWLFYWLRSLRVLYSMALIAAVYFLARAISVRPWLALAAACLLALSPLEWVLAHSATGDIGVSFFGAGLLLALHRYARHDRLLWLMAAGILGGFTFASKYQGLLISGAALSFIFLRDIFFRAQWGRWLGHSLAYLVSLLAGMLIATPQFFIHPAKTRRLIFENMEFIKNYKVPADILAKPSWEIGWLGIKKNAGPLIVDLGPLLLLAALAGLILITAHLLRQRMTAAPDEQVRLSYGWSVIALPFYCLAISLYGKYNIQPFHFAYLGVPLVAGAFFAVERIAAAGWLKSAGLLSMALLLQWIPDIGREYYHWSRPESHEVLIKLGNQLPGYRANNMEGLGYVRALNAERGNLAVFRNRDHQLQLPHSIFWKQIGQAPVPDVPMPGRPFWIFDNGPVYPRNDRAFVIPSGQAVERIACWMTPPEKILIGLRSGSFPARITLRAGNQSYEWTLEPHSQYLATLPADLPEPIKPGKTEMRLPLAFESIHGTAWATLISSDRGAAIFSLFGGDQSGFPAVLAEDLTRKEEIVKQVPRMSYYEHRGGPHKIFAKKSLSLLDYDPLAAGAYRVSAVLLVQDSGAKAFFKTPDPFSGQAWIDGRTSPVFDLPAGIQTVEWSFEKHFFPHDYNLDLEVQQGGVTVLFWELKPDSGKILSDLQQWKDAGVAPAWSRQHPDQPSTGIPDIEGSIRFGDSVAIRKFQVAPGRDRQHLELRILAEQREPDADMYERNVFVHLTDASSKLHGVAWVSLHRTLASPQLSSPIVCRLDAPLSPGTYQLWLGVDSTRTLKRMSVACDPGRTTRKSLVYMGDLTLP